MSAMGPNLATTADDQKRSLGAINFSIKFKETQLIFLAFRNTLRKFYWLPIAIILSRVVVFLWGNGHWNYVELLEIVLISGLISILGVSILGVPVEYNRLKRLGAGLHVSNS